MVFFSNLSYFDMIKKYRSWSFETLRILLHFIINIPDDIFKTFRLILRYCDYITNYLHGSVLS